MPFACCVSGTVGVSLGNRGVRVCSHRFLIIGIEAFGLHSKADAYRWVAGRVDRVWFGCKGECHVGGPNGPICKWAGFRNSRTYPFKVEWRKGPAFSNSTAAAPPNALWGFRKFGTMILGILLAGSHVNPRVVVSFSPFQFGHFFGAGCECPSRPKVLCKSQGVQKRRGAPWHT